MTDKQLYLAIGLPIFAVFLAMLTNIVAIMWQSKNTERTLSAKIDGLRNEMVAEFKATGQALLRVEQVMDARVKWLEEHNNSPQGTALPSPIVLGPAALQQIDSQIADPLD